MEAFYKYTNNCLRKNHVTVDNTIYLVPIHWFTGDTPAILSLSLPLIVCLPSSETAE